MKCLRREKLNHYAGISVRVIPPHLERFVHLEQAAGQFDDVVADRALLRDVVDSDGALGQALDQDVAHVIHFQFETLKKSSENI